MKIAIGSDHRGFIYKQLLQKHFETIVWKDCGTDSTDNVDYPLYVQKVVQAVLTKEVERGIVLCGSGIGVSIAANRHKGIYAALAWSPEIARLSREHNNANVLALPADFMSQEELCDTVEQWVTTSFLENERYQRRIVMLDS